MFNEVTDYILSTYGTKPLYTIFLVALLYLCISLKKHKEFLIVIIGFVLLSNDVSMELIRNFKSGSYYRFYWMLCIPIVIGIAYVRFINSIETKKVLGTTFIVFIGIILLENVPTYKWTNTYIDMISPEFKEVVDIMDDDSVVLCSQSQAMILRQYNAACKLIISDNHYRNIIKLRHQENYVDTELSYMAKPINFAEDVNEEYFFSLCRKNKVDYILLSNNNSVGVEMLEHSSEAKKRFMNDSYVLYEIQN